MATEPLNLDPVIFDEVENYVANLPDNEMNAYLTELEMITQGSIHDKTLRFLNRSLMRRLLHGRFCDYGNAKFSLYARSPQK